MEKREPSYTVGRNEVGTAAVENSVKVPQKTKNRVAIGSINPNFWSYIWKKNNLKGICTPVFIAALFTIAKT